MQEFELAIFDLGNVLYPIHIDRAFAVWSRYSGKPTEHFDSQNVFDAEYALYEKGQITTEEYHAHFIGLMDMSLSFDQWVEGWNAIYGASHVQVVYAVKNLVQSMKVVALTNTNPLHSTIWPKLYAEELSYFHHIYASDKLALRKPEQEIFRFVLQACDAKPEETVYFDDMPEFVEGASALGIHGVVVSEPSDILEELQRLGLN